MALKSPLRSFQNVNHMICLTMQVIGKPIYIKFYLYEKKHNYYSNIRVISKKNQKDEKI